VLVARAIPALAPSGPRCCASKIALYTEAVARSTWMCVSRLPAILSATRTPLLIQNITLEQGGKIQDQADASNILLAVRYHPGVISTRTVIAVNSRQFTAHPITLIELLMGHIQWPF